MGSIVKRLLCAAGHASRRQAAVPGLLVCALATVIGVGAATIAARPPAPFQPAPRDELAVRRPAVAGSFYPADAQALRRAIDQFLRDARAQVSDRPVALVAPHAGYVFAGQIAADAFAQVRGQTYDTVVVLGANHTGAGAGGNAVFPGSAFSTPLGPISLDREVVARLLAAGADIKADAAPHENEHSIEVLVPFVQVLFPTARLVPIVVGDSDPRVCARLGRTLAGALEGRRALVVASSDLSHYPSARDAAPVDRRTLDAMASLNPDILVAHARSVMSQPPAHLVTVACGFLPVLTAITAAKHLGATAATVVSYANSADTPVGDPDRVVGYGAVVFHVGPRRLEAPRTSGSEVERVDRGATSAEQQALLGLARESIARYLESGTLPLPRDFDPWLTGRKQGAFVTLERRGQLRGCIGRLTGEVPLPQLVSRVAVEAAVNDSRFPPVVLKELHGLDIEISLLSTPRKVDAPGDIVVGRDGVVLQKAGRSAVFLPRVASDQGWSRERMLDQLCAKAGLPVGCWASGAALATFQAQVFSDRGAR